MDKSKWTYKKLGEVCDYSSERCDLSTISVDNYVGVDNMLKDRGGKVKATTLGKVTSAIAYRENDILLGNIRPYLKKIWQADSCGGASGDVLVLQTKDSVKDALYPRFLYYALSSDRFFDYDSEHSKGVKMPRGDKKEILKYQIPIPPINVQKEFASSIDQLSELISLKQQQLKEYDALAQSLFYDMFGDPMINEKQFKESKLGDITKVGSSKRVFSTEFMTEGIPFYRGTEIAAIADGTYNEPTLFITKERYEELINQTGKPLIGDLLLPSICPNGRIMIVKDNSPFYIKDGRVLWIRANANKFDSEYLRKALGIILTNDYNRYASGATFKELKIFTLSSVPIPLPPLSLQHSFAEKVRAIEAQKHLVKQSIAETQTLLDSRMQEYFS